MGWTGSFMHYTSRDTNKDLFLRENPSIAKGVEEGKYKVSQKGSNVYVLYQCDIPESKNYGKWFVCCYLCRRDRGEFFTKDIDAISNHCFGIPKSWLYLLDSSDSKVAEYLKARKAYEQKSMKFEIGDYVKCVADCTISWADGYEIKMGETFYVQIYKSGFTKRMTKGYKVVAVDGHGLRSIRSTTFKYLKDKQKMSEQEIKVIYEQIA